MNTFNSPPFSPSVLFVFFPLSAWSMIWPFLFLLITCWSQWWQANKQDLAVCVQEKLASFRSMPGCQSPGIGVFSPHSQQKTSKTLKNTQSGPILSRQPQFAQWRDQERLATKAKSFAAILPHQCWVGDAWEEKGWRVSEVAHYVTHLVCRWGGGGTQQGRSSNHARRKDDQLIRTWLLKPVWLDIFAGIDNFGNASRSPGPRVTWKFDETIFLQQSSRTKLPNCICQSEERKRPLLTVVIFCFDGRGADTWPEKEVDLDCKSNKGQAAMWPHTWRHCTCRCCVKPARMRPPAAASSLQEAAA